MARPANPLSVNSYRSVRKRSVFASSGEGSTVSTWNVAAYVEASTLRKFLEYVPRFVVAPFLSFWASRSADFFLSTSSMP
jgi:hypothetical protein